jgi:DNA ligase (NAD+)
VKKHDIKIGAKILIIRSGEIIPKHLETIEDGTHWCIPDVCPSCGSKLEVSLQKGKEPLENLTCINANCSAQLFEIVLHYARIVEMDHVDEGVLMGLWEKQIVKSIPDLYRLNLKTLESLVINGKNLGSSRAKKIISSVAKISKLPLGIFIGALGIPKVGKNTGQGIAKHFGSLDAILTAKPDEFYGLKAFADTKVDIVHTGIQNRLPLIKELLQYVTIVTDNAPVVVNDTLKGATFVITGTLANPREEVEKLLIAAGGVLQTAVSKSTNYLVVGDSPGASKTEKAQKLKTRTINEDQLMEFIARGPK